MFVHLQVLAAKGHEGTGVQEFCRPSGICCDDKARVVVADSKNQRVLVFSPLLEFLWAVSLKLVLVQKNLKCRVLPRKKFKGETYRTFSSSA